MAMPPKRPLSDPNQYYAYVWRLKGEVLWVGHGKNNRGRPTCKASWSGRPEGLIEVLQLSRFLIEVEVHPCSNKQEARNLERSLIEKLQPKFNTVPGVGGYKGMHTPQGLENIRKAQLGRVCSQEEREARSKRMLGNKNLLGHKHSEETKAKISRTFKEKRNAF